MKENRYKVLENRNCFITGATGGLGRSIALKFAEKRCNLFLTSTDNGKLKELKKEIKFCCGNDIKIYWKAGNLNNIRDVEKIITETKRKLSSVDILVNCAGIFLVETLTESELKDFEKVFNINVRSVFLFSKEFSTSMKKRQWGRIVNIGSSSAYAGFKETSVYCASKHALLGFSRSLYDELKEYNVRVFCISPGSVKTDMGKLVKNQDFNTFIEPTEIADLILFIVTFDAEMILEEIRLNRMIIK